MDYMLMPLRRYADFQGRSRRKEYWMFTLGVVLLYIVFVILAGISGLFSSFGPDGGSQGPSIFGWIVIALIAVAVIGLIIPSIAVQVRRFHDQDKSGWFCLLSFIPYIGGIIVTVFMIIDGTRGPNRFGEDPKTHQSLTDVFS